MTHLAVTLHYQGTVVEQRNVRLRDGLTLGCDPDAVASFPGARLILRRDGPGWRVWGQRLVPGRTLVLGFGDFSVALDLVTQIPLRRSSEWSADLRVLVATAALALLAAWADTAHRVVDANPEIADAVHALVFAPEAPSTHADTVEQVDAEWPPAVSYTDAAPRSELR